MAEKLGRKIMVVWSLVLVSFCWGQQTWTVPGTCEGEGWYAICENDFDVPTIQLAISLASDGDTIIVEPGVYYEAISYLNKELTIHSIDPNNTTINAKSDWWIL